MILYYIPSKPEPTQLTGETYYRMTTEYKEISIILLHDKRSTFFVIYPPLYGGMVAFMFCRRLEFYLRVPCVY